MTEARVVESGCCGEEGFSAAFSGKLNTGESVTEGAFQLGHHTV